MISVGAPLSLAAIFDVARHGKRVTLHAGAREKMIASRAAVDAICAQGDDAQPVYGINTGFGALAETRVAAADLLALQQNLIRSHATGVGPNLEVPFVRGMMLLRAQVLALGHSGVRPEVADLLLAMLNANIHPRIPAQGSVGASGDLAPLAHLCLAMIGEGEACEGTGSYEPSDVVLARHNLAPLTLQAKEGLALINGTQYMTSLGALAVADALELCTIADIAGAMSLEAQMGTSVPFDARLQAARPHPGQRTVANNLLSMLSGSEIAISHKDCGRVQDAYSVRCMPQVHGATRDALTWIAAVLEREANSVTDNPSVFLTDEGADILSGGNFHGQPIALALDLAAIAVAELANISERRVEQLVNPALSSGLTPFLAPRGGLHSGLMIAQVVSASLVSENKVLAHPASVDSIPSSAGREDHVSMGSISAKKLCEVVTNVRRALAIELMAAAVGVDQRAPLKPARGVHAAHVAIREKVAPLVADRPLYRDIEAISDLILTRGIRNAVEKVIGALS